jgi:hypothetical protein
LIRGFQIWPFRPLDTRPAAAIGLFHTANRITKRPICEELQGFQSLTGTPFTIPPMDPNYTYQQVIILLTDGLNTQDRRYGNGSSPWVRSDCRPRSDPHRPIGISVFPNPRPAPGANKPFASLRRRTEPSDLYGMAARKRGD